MRNTMAGNVLVFKRASLLAWLLAALCWEGCRKTELPPEVREQPVFSVQVDNVVSIQAGVDYTYLFTDFAKDEHNVLTFKGKFASQLCKTDSCRGSVQFEFRNLFVGNDVLVGEAFHIGEFAYADKNSVQGNTTYRTTFSVQDTTGFKSFIWNFDNMGTATGPVVQRDYQSNQPVRVDLISIPNTNIPVSTVSHLVALTGGAKFPAVRLRIVRDSANNLVEALTTGTKVTDYHWLPDSLEQDSFLIEPFLNEFYGVTVTDNFGNTASVVVDGTHGANGVFVTPDYNASVQAIPPGDSLQLGRVAIQWVDFQGVIWRSDLQAQPPASQFIVTASEAYELNEKGQKTQKMTVNFKCLLYSPKGETKEFEGSGVIAVAY